MVSVGLCMIVKNEEDVLERCLESAADLVDEIIIADTGDVLPEEDQTSFLALEREPGPRRFGGHGPLPHGV